MPADNERFGKSEGVTARQLAGKEKVVSSWLVWSAPRLRQAAGR